MGQVQCGQSPVSCNCPVTGAKALDALGECPYVEIVKKTTPAVGPKVEEIVDDFYERLFKNNPETKAFFNPANQYGTPPSQRKALSNAIVAYATNVDKLENLTEAVKIIAHKHCAVGVQPEHYGIVHKNLMASIAHVLGAAVTPEVGEGWSEAVLALAGVLIDTEKKLYQDALTRSGGWNGTKDFKVVEINDVTSTCKEFTFEAVKGATTPIDFAPGQYLTVHLKLSGATPRHYTVVNSPGHPHLKCCVKLIPGGFASASMHTLSVGSSVGLSSPYGAFTYRGGPAVLISAGIGVTAAKSILAAHPKKVRFAMHIDKSENDHPYLKDFVDSGVKTSFHYTSKNGRPTVDNILMEVQPFLKECDFYVAAPPDLLAEIAKALTSASAKSVNVDVYGPALA